MERPPSLHLPGPPEFIKICEILRTACQAFCCGKVVYTQEWYRDPANTARSMVLPGALKIRPRQ